MGTPVLEGRREGGKEDMGEGGGGRGRGRRKVDHVSQEISEIRKRPGGVMAKFP